MFDLIQFEGKNDRQERRARKIIAGNRQRELNVKEWCRRAKLAIDDGEIELAINLLEQSAID